MNFSKEQIHAFHAALHQACGVIALRPTMADERAWWDFLQEMAPLDDTGEPFSTEDIVQVLRHMQYEKREGKAGWSLRPSAILRTPETFRDLILLTRSKRKPLKAAPIAAPRKAPERVSDFASHEEAAAEFSRLRREFQGGAA